MQKDLKYNIIALFGEKGNGKGTVLNWMVSHYPDQIHKIISCTTRPLREGERDGDNYHFISADDFTLQTLNGTMLEATSFRDQFYGTQLTALDANKINIGIFSLEALHCLLEDPRLNVFPVYVWAADKVRLMRALTKEDKPNCKEVCQQFLTDLKDFEKMDENYHYIIWPNSDNEQRNFPLMGRIVLNSFSSSGQ